jgi:hypothetical protein
MTVLLSTTGNIGVGKFNRKNRKKNLDTYFFVTLFDFLSYDENSRIRIQDPDPNPDPLVRGMDPRIRIHPKMS